MKVLLTGAAGQLGQALMARTPKGIELLPSSRNGGDGVLAQIWPMPRLVAWR